MAGIYIHIPFCQSRCMYCDFYSTTHSGEWMSQYLLALQREFRSRQDQVGQGPFHTLYVGGGTPSQLPPHLLRQLFYTIEQHFSLHADAEVTIEANPEDVTPAWLAALRHTPANRISMGVQTFHNDILSFLRRRHNAATAIRAVKLCRQAGYHNLSLDLIYGLPRQSLDIWQADLEQITRLRVPHLSAYALQYEPGTTLYNMKQQGLVEEADEELSVQMYHLLCTHAQQMGMEHYEVSNFGLPGYRSCHNSSYWQQQPYWGFGPGAHSYDGLFSRRWNSANLTHYLQAQADVPHDGETLTPEERYNEIVFTRLRTSDGLPLHLLCSADRAYCLRMSSPHLHTGQLILQNNTLCLHPQAVFVSDGIVSDLMR